MPATPLDSPMYRALLVDDDIARLFSDSAEVRAMLLVEGALAKAQGKLGLIPEISAAAIERASREVTIDPAALAAETGQNAVVVPALVAAFRAEMQAPEHAQYIHWGATSQDIMDTALVLRLRQATAIYRNRLRAVLRDLARLASDHAETPMLARTYGQAAVVTSFGAQVATWGAPLLDALSRLEDVSNDIAQISLSGAAGTLSAMGDQGPAVRAEMAAALSLRDPGTSWHANRDPLIGLAAWMTRTSGALAKIGEDLILATQSGIGEVTLAASGGSSTMPQKQNPVQPSLLVALARLNIGLNATLGGAAIHRQQRDGAAWISEWLTLPQMVMATGRALQVGEGLAASLAPNADAMEAAIAAQKGLICAEALSFALATHMPRPEAQAAVKRLAGEVRDSGVPLSDLAAREWPDHDLSAVFDTRAQLGTAPDEARSFAELAGTA